VGSPRTLPPPIKHHDHAEGGITVNEIALEYWRYSTSYYEVKAAGHSHGDASDGRE